MNLWRLFGNAGDGEKLLAVLGVLGIVAAVIIGLAELSHSTGGPSSTGTHGKRPVHRLQTAGTTRPQAPVKRKYLAKLPAKEGEDPESGTVHVGGRRLPDSIFWEKVGSPGSSAFCGSSRYECRAVTYELGGKYNHFKAFVGGETPGSSEQAYSGHWWVVRDGEVEQGTFNLNRPPQAIELSVSGVHTLELRVTAEAAGNEPTLAWGEAQVS
jgi:hypothetical protein